jgi:hypothetical protein
MRFRNISDVHGRLHREDQTCKAALQRSGFVISALKIKEVEMEPEEEKKIASALARQAVTEDERMVKVVVAETGRVAETVFELLTRVHRISQNKITRLGYSSSDQQNDQLMRQKRPFVIVPKDIINNRPCTFYLPEQTNRLATIQYLDGEIFSLPITCESAEFQFKPGWFS